MRLYSALPKDLVIHIWRSAIDSFSSRTQVLTKDLEKKEQAQARVLNQHHELQQNYHDSERERERLCLQLEDALRKFKEQAR